MIRQSVFRLSFIALGSLLWLIPAGGSAQDINGPSEGYNVVPGDEVWRYPEATSQWLEQQRDRARAALEGRQYDVLVVPMQARGQSFDASGRSLMTLSVANAIATRSDLSVADPVLVARALGLHERQFDDEKVTALAEQLGVQKILVLDVGHNGKGAFRVRSRVSAPGESLSLADAEGVVETSDTMFNDIGIPYYRFAAMRDEIAIRVAGALRPEPDAYFEDAMIDFPVDADDFVEPASDILGVHYLQFAAVLGSRNLIERSRDMMFERSLVMLESIDDETPHYYLLKARALFYLNRLPAALLTLGAPETLETPEQKAFFELLSGNYTRIEEHVEAIESPLLKMIATIESERLRYDYHGATDSDAATAVVDAHPVWGPFLYVAMLDEDIWTQHSSVYVKIGADFLLPIERYSLEAFGEVLEAAGESPTEYKVAELAFSHIDELDKRDKGAARSFIGPRTGDLTDMLRTQLAGEVIGYFDYWRTPQGRYRDAIALADEFEPLIAGHPTALAWLSYAYQGEKNKRRGAERKSLERESDLLNRQSVQISKGLYRDTLGSALVPKWGFSKYADYPRETQSLLLHASDWPWPPTGLSSGPARVRAQTSFNCIKYSNWDVYCLKRLEGLYGNTEAGRAWLKPVIGSIADRYHGSPERSEVIARFHFRSGEFDAAWAVYEDAIANDSPEWSAYTAIARRHARELRFDEALAVYESYPGFTDSRVSSTVGLSNNTENAATMFFYSGLYEHAVPLYLRSASYRSGSDSGIRSEANLALVRGDYETAIEQTTDRIRRYGTDIARRDLMGLAAITGQAALLQGAVNGALDHLNSHWVWDGLLIAHRAQGMDSEERIRWAIEEGAALPRNDGMLWAMRYIMLDAVTDRAIPADFPERFEALDTREQPRRLGDGRLLRDGKHVDPPRFSDTRLPIGPDQPDIEFRYSIAYGMRALAAIDNGDYEAAFKALDGATDVYHLESYLPYYALAAAMVGDTARVETYLERLTEDQARVIAGEPAGMGHYFFGHVAEAALAGIAGRHAEALQSLRLASADHGLTGHKSIYSRYLLIEIARMLLEETGNDDYREFALDAARRSAVTQPYLGFTHSFVAMLSPDREERVESLARLLILDPGSRAIQRAKKRELKAARKLAENGYPMPPNRIESEAVAMLPVIPPLAGSPSSFLQRGM